MQQGVLAALEAALLTLAYVLAPAAASAALVRHPGTGINGCLIVLFLVGLGRHHFRHYRTSVINCLYAASQFLAGKKHQTLPEIAAVESCKGSECGAQSDTVSPFARCPDCHVHA